MKRLFDILLVIMIMAMAWPLRGQFGHLKGALIPGAAVAVMISVLAKDPTWREAFGRAVIFGSLGFALGGHMGYGKIIDFVIEQPQFWQETFSFAKLFWIGALWGGLGGTFLGFAYSEKPVRFSDMAVFAVFFAVCLVLLGFFDLDRWDWPIFGIGLAAFHLYNALVKRSPNVFIFGITGLLGSGLGFAGAVAVLAAGKQDMLGEWPWWWTWRDQIWGACLGLFLLAAVWFCERNKNYPAAWPGFPAMQKEGFITLVILIPYLNTLNVFLYWFKYQRVYLKELKELWILFAGLTVFFLAEFLFWLRSDEKIRFKLDTLLITGTLSFFWYMVALALAKNIVIFGTGRWESGFTLFLLCLGALTVLLPVRIYGRDRF